jgi:hypothetical protein
MNLQFLGDGLYAEECKRSGGGLVPRHIIVFDTKHKLHILYLKLGEKNERAKEKEQDCHTLT